MWMGLRGVTGARGSIWRSQAPWISVHKSQGKITRCFASFLWGGRIDCNRRATQKRGPRSGVLSFWCFGHPKSGMGRRLSKGGN